MSRLQLTLQAVRRCEHCDSPAPTHFRRDSEGRIVECLACRAYDMSVHVESKACWCEPQVVFRDPRTGRETVLHREWQ